MKFVYEDSRLVGYADEGMYITNGEIFGKQIYLSDSDSPENYTEISEKEYESILETLDGDAGLNQV